MHSRRENVARNVKKIADDFPERVQDVALSYIKIAVQLLFYFPKFGCVAEL